MICPSVWPSEAAFVIAKRAAAIGAPLCRWGREWRSVPTEDGMRYEGRLWQFDLPRPALLGLHQIVNAGTAIACLEQLTDLPVSAGAIAQGLRRIEWPARLQRLGRGPLVALMPGWELWLDGGHNPGCGEVLAAVAADWRDRPLHLVAGMLNTKDATGFFRPLAPYAKALRAVTIPGEENALPAEAIAAAARAAGIAAETAPSLAAALAAIAGESETGRVLICGSLHLAGVVLADNG